MSSFDTCELSLKIMQVRVDILNAVGDEEYLYVKQLNIELDKLIVDYETMWREYFRTRVRF